MEESFFYLGTWFPRTSLHLKEFYNFLTKKEGLAGLDKSKIETLWNNLNFKKAQLHLEPEIDFLEVNFGDIELKITEDGIITMSNKIHDFKKSRQISEQFYTQKLAPAISYLFSVEAQLPKLIESAENIYPVFFITGNMPHEKIKELFDSFNEKIISHSKSPYIEIYYGENFNTVNIISQMIKRDIAEQFLQSLILFKEFEDQLNRYLNLHRKIWDKVSKIRNAKNIRYKEFQLIRNQLREIEEETYHIDIRLEQMGDILTARNELTSQFLKQRMTEIGINRFITLKAEQRYISNLWKMTSNYVDDTFEILNTLYEENTHKELNAIKLATFMTVLTGFFGMNIGFPWEERWKEIYPSSIKVSLFVIFFSVVIYLVLRLFFSNRKFKM